MFSRKAGLKDFITENMTFIIILVVVIAVLFILYFSGAISIEGIRDPTSEFGRTLIEMFGAGR